MEVISVVISIPSTRVGAGTETISTVVDVEIGSGATVVVSIAVDVEAGSGMTVVVSIAVDVEMGTEGVLSLSVEKTMMVEVTKTVGVAAVGVVVVAGSPGTSKVQGLDQGSSLGSEVVQMPQSPVSMLMHSGRCGGQSRSSGPPQGITLGDQVSVSEIDRFPVLQS